MKVLLVNKFHYLKGGSEKYYLELAKLLKEKGHEVAFFSMQDKKNIKTDCKEYFVKPIDLNNGSKLKAFEVIYSKKNRKQMEYALDDFKPDIVHLNNFQRQLSESVVEAVVEKNIPIIFTAHDIQATCPAITMIDNNKNICEKCMGGKYLNCVKKKCNKGSTLKSLIGAIEGKYYRNKKVYTKKINRIITPSEFYKEKLIQDGISQDKINTIHNFINLEEYNIPISDEGYALYIGRLSKEKGILNLVQAFEKINQGRLYIAGEGQEKENILKFIEEKKLQDKIKLLGFLNKEQVKEKIAHSRFIVVPSIWYENCPYSIMETLAIGKPVIGSRIGGIPELIKENENGLLYKFDDIDDLSKKMKKLFEDKELAKKMGQTAKLNAQNEFDKEIYYENIIKIYNQVKNNEKRTK